MKLLNVTKSILATFAILTGSSVAAAPINIVSMPSSNGPGFQHNNFHDASKANGTNGIKLAWFTLGAGGGTYDPVTGDFNANIDIFEDKALTIFIGTAVGTGNLAIAEFNGNDGSTIGSITWDFDNVINAAGLADVTTTFLDLDYNSTSSQGYSPNTVVGTAMTLWGGGTTTTGQYPDVGVDFVTILETSPVPVPAAVWLFGSGLLALTGFARRKAV